MPRPKPVSAGAYTQGGELKIPDIDGGHSALMAVLDACHVQARTGLGRAGGLNQTLGQRLLVRAAPHQAHHGLAIHATSPLDVVDVELNGG